MSPESHLFRTMQFVLLHMLAKYKLHLKINKWYFAYFQQRNCNFVLFCFWSVNSTNLAKFFVYFVIFLIKWQKKNNAVNIICKVCSKNSCTQFLLLCGGAFSPIKIIQRVELWQVYRPQVTTNCWGLQLGLKWNWSFVLSKRVELLEV